jgi:hypothetical protein
MKPRMGKQTELTKITLLVRGCDRPSMVANLAATC